jgi:hypothetical protein
MTQILDLFQKSPEQTAVGTYRKWTWNELTQMAQLWGAVVGVTVLIILFEVVGTVRSVLQYRLAIKAYKVSVVSHELELAVACQQKTALLIGFDDAC